MLTPSVLPTRSRRYDLVPPANQHYFKMSSTSTVTWAIPVEACLLGARLEAYVESKATISTLRLCAKKGNPSEAPLAKLPQELTEEIVKHVQHPLIEKKLQEWKDMTYCLEGKCQYLRGHKNDHSLNHHVRLDRHISKLSRQTQQSEEGERFAKCRKVGNWPFFSLFAC